MNKSALKSMVILSSIIGMIFGLVASLPYIGGIALFFILVMTAPIVILLLIMNGKMDLTTPKDSIINGAIIGFFSNITFAFAYSVVIAMLYLIAKYTSNYLLLAMIINSPIWLFILVVIFIGILTATTNAFSGFLTYYIINFIRDLYEKRHSD